MGGESIGKKPQPVDIDWNWGGLANFLGQLELEVDRGRGFVLLAINTTP